MSDRKQQRPSLINVASTCAATQTTSHRAVPSQCSACAWNTVYRTAYGSQCPPSIHIALEKSTRTGLLDNSWMLVDRCRRNSSSNSGDMWCIATVVMKRIASQMYVPGARPMYDRAARETRLMG